MCSDDTTGTGEGFGVVGLTRANVPHSWGGGAEVDEVAGKGEAGRGNKRGEAGDGGVK